jgi:hypothetical protein
VQKRERHGAHPKHLLAGAREIAAGGPSVAGHRALEVLTSDKALA